MSEVRYEAILPFDGFYESCHDRNLDDALENMFTDWDGNEEVNESLLEKAFNDIEWKQVHLAYSQMYMRELLDKLEIEAQFVTLESPRYYNFETDRIVVSMSEKSLLDLRSRVNNDTLVKRIEERFTSRSGFISFYPASLNEWPSDVRKWDHNQIGTLFEVLQKEMLTNDDMIYLMDDCNCNGEFEAIISDAMGEKANRVYKIHSYLENRKERKAA
jgi:hypothetical protein